MALQGLESPSGASHLLSPPWNLMCLQAYLHKHTRHISRFIDCRLMSDLEAELVARLELMQPPRILVINCPILSLGQVAAVLEICKRNIPNMRTVLCGAYPSAFPDKVAEIPRVDFALAGDPEPILRSLLDHIDIETRQRRIPGLIMNGSLETTPHWLKTLDRLAIPSWDGIFWGEYGHGLPTHLARAEVRLSRGHSGNSADRASESAHEPFRLWPIKKMAALLSHSNHVDLSEFVLTDPPGLWTAERLRQWTAALASQRSVHPWSLRLFPIKLDEDIVADMVITRCRRVELVFPTCDRTLLRQYGISDDWQETADMIETLRDNHIEVLPRFWIGGPEEERGEEKSIAQMIRRFRFFEYVVEPFPFTLDSPLYNEQTQEATPPGLREWIQWSRDPWTGERPVPLWGGRKDLPRIAAQLKFIRKTVDRSPAMLMMRVRRGLNPKHWIESIESWALGLLHRNS